MGKRRPWGFFLGALELIQAAQTAALLTVAIAVIAVLALLRTELKKAAAVLAEVISGQKELDRNVRRAWERIDAIEKAQRSDLTARRDERPPGSSP